MNTNLEQNESQDPGRAEEQRQLAREKKYDDPFFRRHGVYFADREDFKTRLARAQSDEERKELEFHWWLQEKAYGNEYISPSDNEGDLTRKRLRESFMRLNLDDAPWNYFICRNCKHWDRGAMIVMSGYELVDGEPLRKGPSVEMCPCMIDARGEDVECVRQGLGVRFTAGDDDCAGIVCRFAPTQAALDEMLEEIRTEEQEKAEAEEQEYLAWRGRAYPSRCLWRP